MLAVTGFNWPPIEDLDVEDLLALPEGYRYELHEGNLVIMTPSSFWHKEMTRRLLFMLHAAEIALFAYFYLAAGAIDTLEQALYFSASSYSTLGHPDIPFPDQWRLVGAIEGLAGFLLIGWSTAVFVTDMNKLLRK